MAAPERDGLNILRDGLKTIPYLIGALLIVGPLFFTSYWIGLLTQMIIFALLAMSLDLLLGYTGLPSLGHAGLFGVAAYTVAVLSTTYHASFWLCVLSSIVLGTLISGAFGLLVSHVRDVYFLMITLALGMVLWGLSYRWIPVTGGDNGIAGIPRLEAHAGLPVTGPIPFYYITLLTFIACAASMAVLVASPFGFTLRGIRENESRMKSLGFNTWLHCYLHTYYGESHVLQGVTLSVEKGSVTAVLGRNGVGKTTLCKTVVGLAPARAGRIVLDGADITRLPPHEICGIHLGLVPQGCRIFPSLTVYENLAIAHQRESDACRWDIDAVFAQFPRLADRRHHRGNELSGGEQQILAIARALVANRPFLVMDEPTEGLAPAFVAEITRLIRRLRDEGTSILLAEQNAAFAVTAADYVHVMSKGAIVYSSEPAALWNNDAIKTQFLGVPRSA